MTRIDRPQTRIEPGTLPFLPVTAGNYLLLTKRETTRRKGMDNDDDYYDELAADGAVVARYHVWHHMNIYPLQTSDEGWRKFSPDGSEIASGKRD